MEPSIWRFTLFVVSICAWIVFCFAPFVLLGYLTLRSDRIKAVHLVSTAILLEVITFAFLILFMLILTGSAHMELFAVLIAAAIIGYLLAEFLWLIVGRRAVPYASCIIWSRYELQSRFPFFARAIQIGGLLPIVAYPIYIGIKYFGGHFQPEDWERFVLKTTIVVFGISWIMQLLGNLYVVASENITGGTRARILLNQLAQTPSILVFISVFLWTTAAAGDSQPLVGGYFVYSPTITYITVGYVLLFVLLPFIVGYFRSRSWIESLETHRDDLVKHLSETLRSVKITQAISEVDALRLEIEKELNELQSDPGIALAGRVANGVDPNEALYRIALRDMLKYDPRVVHLRELGALHQHIIDTQDAVSKATNDQEKREILRDAAALIEKRASSPYDRESKLSATVLVILSGALSGISSPVIASVGKWLATRLGLPG